MLEAERLPPVVPKRASDCLDDVQNDRPRRASALTGPRLKSPRAAKRGHYQLRVTDGSSFHHEIHSIQSLRAAAHLLQSQ
jgi:hypothetical protein